MTARQRAQYLIARHGTGVLLSDRLTVVFEEYERKIQQAKADKDKAWLEEIASHGGWASDVICTRCMPHREHRHLNLSAEGSAECGYCAYLQGRQEFLADRELDIMRIIGVLAARTPERRLTIPFAEWEHATRGRLVREQDGQDRSVVFRFESDESR